MNKRPKKISSEINDNILKDIREDIRKLNDEKESPENETLELTPPPTTTPDPMIKQTIAAIEKAGDFTIENHIDPHPTVQEHIPMVDHLLTTPVSQHIQTEVRKVEEKRSYTSDPYREEV